MRTHEDEHCERYAGCHGEPDDDDQVTGWCECCGAECYGVAVDNGIGSYEYWGSKGVHHQIDCESNCCNAKVLDHDPNPDEEDCDVSES